MGTKHIIRNLYLYQQEALQFSKIWFTTHFTEMCLYIFLYKKRVQNTVLLPTCSFIVH